MKIFITGSAGFVGFSLAKHLLEKGHEIHSIDNINDYYNKSLKLKRLEILQKYPKFSFEKCDLLDKSQIKKIFKENSFKVIVHLAAQAGVRHSLTNPYEYIDSNIIGFLNILEEIKDYGIEHFLYASSSSVYGMNKEIPFSTMHNVDNPVSLYAASKKSNELMAFAYSHLYKIPTTGLRFFTVYGPYGRPDMAYYSFTKNIDNNKTIKVFNNGDMQRDFTYIDDIVNYIELLLKQPPCAKEKNYRLLNLGNNNPVRLNYFIKCIEAELGKTAKKKNYPLQPGDVINTYADIDPIIELTGYRPQVNIEKGLKIFVEWYKKNKEF